MGRWFVLALMISTPALNAQEATPVPAAAPGPVLSGAELFKERGCLQCHALHGVGGHKGPDLSAVGKRMKPEAIRTQINEGGGAMPPYSDALGDGELEKLVDFLRRQRK